MATSLTASMLGQVLGPVSLSGTEEAITITFQNGILGFMLLADGDWLYHSTAAQSNLLPVKANQSFILQTQSVQAFVFYAKSTGTPKLYIVPVST